MILTDVNILVHAYRRDAELYEPLRQWLEEAMNAIEPLGVSDFISSAFVRIVTNPRIYPDPSPMEPALSFIELVRTAPSSVVIYPGPGHWQIFANLCRATNAQGNLVPDAYFASLAIESGSEWISMDRDFARFPGLRWRRPF
jgi:toxin-antitoxin system PIN domain toxin